MPLFRPFVGTDIQPCGQDEQDGVGEPVRTAELAQRPPVKHDRGQVEEEVGHSYLPQDRVAPCNALQVIYPLAESGP